MTELTLKYKSVAEQFSIEGEILSIEPYGSGHINTTFLLVTDKKRYILQKMNTDIFSDSDALMKNICLVTEHLRKKGVETLTVVRLKNGAPYLKGNECYRVYDFIEDTVAYQQAPNMEVFEASGRAFGEFQCTLADFDASQLSETIKNFHNTPVRFEAFKQALAADTCGRADSCHEECEFVLSHENTYSAVVDALENGSLPLRVTHNDTKLNNILMDAENKAQARAVIDLDTVMPGSMLYDFGDAIRFGASTAAEDEKELEKVNFDISLFKAYAQGYCGALKDSITDVETRMLSYGAYLMTVECGMRFLTDYLNGDTYFATKYPEHNLVRCRTQLKLAGQMEKELDRMTEIVSKIING